MSIFVLMIVLAIGHVQMSMAKDCGPNEKDMACAPALSCQPSCDNPDRTPCPRMCDVNSCVCKEGFVRRSEDDSTCVEKTQCNARKALVCGENEEANSCANPCQPSCEQPDRPSCPTFQCTEGCVCKAGCKRDSNDITSSCLLCPIILN